MVVAYGLTMTSIRRAGVSDVAAVARRSSAAAWAAGTIIEGEHHRIGRVTRTLVVSLPRVIAAVTAKALAAVRAAAPPAVEVRGTGDGLAGAAFTVLSWNVDEAAVREELPVARDLRVVQTLSAGTDWIEPHVPAWATLCSARGSRDVPVAEWVVGALLGAAYGQFHAAALRRWDYEQPEELHGTTVLILGHGSIGRAVEARLAPFGVRVIGVASRAREGVHGVDELAALLPAADAVVVLLPLTDATRGLVSADVLARMPDGALLVSAGRGAVVDTDALVAELRSGRLRAVLDVTDPEPLPDGHPLWDLCLAITPHNAGDSPPADQRAIALAAEQLGRYVRGESLINVVR
jgi:phosphoglycerate dehydrogenase-like enzyme